MTTEQERKERTLGDGMDNTLIVLSEPSHTNPIFDLKLRPAQAILNSLKPVEPQGPVVVLIPKYIPKQKKLKYLTRKPKEPKFVPYEPFKGAVARIIPFKDVVKTASASKNNIDIQDLVVQMSEMRMAEMSKDKIEALRIEEVISKKKWDEEKKAYETDIKNLRESNAHLENQLKFQVQVNSELKTLLVAAVGEDLETRVQHLTEDKLQLARALLNSANHLTSHQEQTEWLSGQCEVWRSKFLASSLMVEELARWKSVLTKRINDVQQSLKSLLDERSKIRLASIKCYSNLLQINNDCFKLDDTSLNTCNLVELSSNNCKFSRAIASRLLNGNVDQDVDHILKLPANTSAESAAMQLLRSPIGLPSKPDALCNAVMGAAMSLGGGQIYLQHPLSHATCCAHCKGDVQEI